MCCEILKFQGKLKMNINIIWSNHNKYNFNYVLFRLSMVTMHLIFIMNIDTKNMQQT